MEGGMRLRTVSVRVRLPSLVRRIVGTVDVGGSESPEGETSYEFKSHILHAPVMEWNTCQAQTLDFEGSNPSRCTIIWKVGSKKCFAVILMENWILPGLQRR